MILLQSSCKYARPLADPNAIFTRTCQSNTGRPFPEVSIMLLIKETSYIKSDDSSKYYVRIVLP